MNRDNSEIIFYVISDKPTANAIMLPFKEAIENYIEYYNLSRIKDK